MKGRKDKGKESEKRARVYLQEQGLKILSCNHREKRGELDIIAREGDVLCVVEVRSRWEGSGLPEAKLGRGKLKAVSGSVSRLLRRRGNPSVPVRMDLLVVDYEQDEIRFYRGGLTPPMS